MVFVVVVIFACGGGGGGEGGDDGDVVFVCGGEVGDEADSDFGDVHSDDSILAFDDSGEGSDVTSLIPGGGMNSTWDLTGAIVGS